MPTTPIDSLRHIVAVKDSLLSAAATKAVTVNVAPSAPPTHGIFDFLILGVTILATFAAAKYGAEAGVKAEWKQRQKDERAREERLLKRFIARLARDATIVAGVAGGIELTNSIKAVVVAAPRQLGLVWDTFASNRAAVELIADPTHAHDVERFYEKMVSLAGWIKEWGASEAELLKTVAEDSQEHKDFTKTARDTFAGTAAKAMTLSKKLAGEEDTDVDPDEIVASTIAHQQVIMARAAGRKAKPAKGGDPPPDPPESDTRSQ